MGLEVKSSLSLSSAFMHNFSVSSSISLLLSTVYVSKSLHLLPPFTPNSSLSHSAFRLGSRQFLCLLSVFDHISSFCDSLSLTQPCDLLSKSDLVSNDHLSNQRTMLYEQCIITRHSCKICRSVSQPCITPTSICPDVDGVKQGK